MRRFHPRYLLILLVPALLCLAACGATETAPVNPDKVKQDLLDKTWYCKKMGARSVGGDAPLTLVFKADGSVSGSGGCNTFAGAYTLEGEELHFAPLVGTRKACGPAADEQEFTYLSFLARVHRFKVEDDELQLFMTDQPVPLLFSTSEGGFSLW